MSITAPLISAIGVPTRRVHSSSKNVAYKTGYGTMLHGSSEDLLKAPGFTERFGKAQLIFTSPPFPLNRKKKYGNLQGEDYVKWLAALAPVFKNLLTPDGSIVMELGNSWEPGEPVMSILAMKSLLTFLETGDLKLFQQFVVHNPARLPSPAEWVTVKRVRVKDAFTHIWWMSPTATPKADNRKVLVEYSPAMKKLLARKSYNAGKHPSEHHIGKDSFLKENGGAIPTEELMAA